MTDEEIMRRLEDGPLLRAYYVVRYVVWPVTVTLFIVGSVILLTNTPISAAHFLRTHLDRAFPPSDPFSLSKEDLERLNRQGGVFESHTQQN